MKREDFIATEKAAYQVAKSVIGNYEAGISTLEEVKSTLTEIVKNQQPFYLDDAGKLVEVDAECFQDAVAETLEEIANFENLPTWKRSVSSSGSLLLRIFQDDVIFS